MYQITARIQKLCYGLDTEYVDPIAYDAGVMFEFTIADCSSVSLRKLSRVCIRA